MLYNIFNRKNISYADMVIAILTTIIGVVLLFKGFGYFTDHSLSPYTTWFYQHKDQPIKAIIALISTPTALKTAGIALCSDCLGIIVMLIGIVFALTGIEGIGKNAIAILKRKTTTSTTD